MAAGAGGDEPPLIVASQQQLELVLPETGAMVELSLDGGLLQPHQGRYTVPPAGDHWLALVSRDRVGNRSPVRWVRLQVDDTPPQTEVALVPEPVAAADGTLWVPAGAKVTLTAEDDLAGVAEVLVRGGMEHRQEGARMTLTLPESGTVKLRIEALDRVGNRGIRGPLLLSIDGTPPGGTIELRGRVRQVEERLLAAPGVAAVAVVNDEGSGVDHTQASTDGREVTESAWNGPWAAGAHRLAYTACDRVGNCATLGVLSMEVDAEPPQLSWSIASPFVEGKDDRTFATPPVQVEVTADDDLAGVERIEWSADGEQWQVVDGELNATSLERLHLRATDLLGNRAEQVASWSIDQNPPVITATEPAATGEEDVLRIGVGGGVRIAATDHGCGVAQVRYLIDESGRWIDLPELFTFGNEGTFDLRVEAIDRLGNSGRRSWRVVVSRAGRGRDGGDR